MTVEQRELFVIVVFGVLWTTGCAVGYAITRDPFWIGFFIPLPGAALIIWGIGAVSNWIDNGR